MARRQILNTEIGVADQPFPCRNLSFDGISSKCQILLSRASLPAQFSDTLLRLSQQFGCRLPGLLVFVQQVFQPLNGMLTFADLVLLLLDEFVLQASFALPLEDNLVALRDLFFQGSHSRRLGAVVSGEQADLMLPLDALYPQKERFAPRGE